MLVRYCMIVVIACCVWSSVRTAEAEETAPDIAAEWTSLVKDMETFKETMKSMKLQFSKANAVERSKLVKESNGLNTKFQMKTLPRLIELAPQVYKLQPANTVAAEFALQTLYAKHQYAELVKVSESVLKLDPKAQLAVNFNGVGKFATHDFDGAINVLKAAEAEGALIPRLGGHYLDLAELYVEFWKQEQAIRAAEDAATGDAQLPIVKLTTTKGEIEILMLENEAPNSVANFISLVEKKYYDGLKFHRVEPHFMAQSGCPNSRDNPAEAGRGGPGYTFACECFQKNARRHFAGSLSMAHAGKDTGGSQFFLTHLPTNHLNPEPGKTEMVHTVFGRTVKGQDVIQSLEIDDEILSAVVVRKRNHEYVPVTVPDKTPR